MLANVRKGWLDGRPSMGACCLQGGKRIPKRTASTILSCFSTANKDPVYSFCLVLLQRRNEVPACSAETLPRQPASSVDSRNTRYKSKNGTSL